MSSCSLDKTSLGWGHEESWKINIESLEWVGPQEKKKAHVPVSLADSRWVGRRMHEGRECGATIIFSRIASKSQGAYTEPRLQTRALRIKVTARRRTSELSGDLGFNAQFTQTPAELIQVWWLSLSSFFPKNLLDP